VRLRSSRTGLFFLVNIEACRAYALSRRQACPIGRPQPPSPPSPSAPLVQRRAQRALASKRAAPSPRRPLAQDHHERGERSRRRSEHLTIIIIYGIIRIQARGASEGSDHERSERSEQASNYRTVRQLFARNNERSDDTQKKKMATAIKE